MNVSVMCDTEINLCYSNPCGQNGVCISLESNYVCVCDADFTGRVCEINLKKSKCSEAKSLVDLDLSMTKLTRPVCRGNSVCKNLILGGFLCDKCDSSEEPSASSYYNHMCELRASNFQSDSYLVLPGIQNRLRFKIKLNFATIKTNGIIFFNGRLSNDSQDLISLAIEDGYLSFEYSFGDQIKQVESTI